MCFETVIGIEPEDAIAWYNKGVVLRRMCKYEDAIQCFDKNLKIVPHFSDAWKNKEFLFEAMAENYDTETKYQ